MSLKVYITGELLFSEISDANLEPISELSLSLGTMFIKGI